MERSIQDLKLAFIGVSHWHVPLYLRAVKSDSLNVVAVSDDSAELAERTAADLGCPSYTDAIRLLDEQQPDFVFAFAPHYKMPELALELIRRGIPFAIEKPLGVCAADVERVLKAAEEKPVEPKAEKPLTIAKPRKPHKARQSVNVSKGMIEEEKEPVKENATLRPVEEGDIVPYEDPMMQFAEQARTLRERGNRVIQRVSMNSIPPDNYPLNDL